MGYTLNRYAGNTLHRYLLAGVLATVSPWAAASGDPTIVFFAAARIVALLVLAIVIAFWRTQSGARLRAFAATACSLPALWLLGLMPNYQKNQVLIESASWLVIAVTIWLSLREVSKNG
ncbi:hypothetical protein G4G28_18405 [Massilia sp. Dwa41.01b]|uniref:hypothetical protein n=1 Tax=unclassified Massilia TaxID=2609279 RepID=UPI0016049294|nr:MULTISPECIES: hypothetical protein [unclassified Massilia]QNA89979.1 hypothetical protein G4G28_18405 [Massilia sp. Dwa41.01b]QNB00862.1 hypothetical protein G4G31_21980 [Massilia sp. Se16.2.3]